MKVSLTRAITGGTLLATILSLAVISGYSYYSSRKALISNAHTILEAHTRNVEQQTKLLLDPVPLLAATMVDVINRSGSPLHKELPTYQFLVEKLKDLPTIYSVYWADTHGQFFLVGRRPLKEDATQIGFFLRTVRVSGEKRVVTEKWFTADGNRMISASELPGDPFDPRLRPWFKVATAAAAPAWSDPYIFYITRKPGITYAIPLYVRGKITGVCAVDLETESLSQYLHQILPTPLSRIFVLTASNQVVGFSDTSKMQIREDPVSSGGLTLKQLSDEVAVATCKLIDQMPFTNNLVSGAVKIDNETFHSQVKSATIHGLKLNIGLAIPDGELFAPLVKSMSKIFIFSLAIMAIIIIVGLLFSRAVAGPLEKLRLATHKIEERKFDELPQLKTIFEEIDVTFSAFCRMHESLKEYLEETQRLNDELRSAHLESLYRLAVAAEYKDRDTATHLNRVSAYSREIARLQGVAETDIDTLFHASLMHDVGKLGIPDKILTKPTAFTPDERRIMQEHTTIGARILSEPTSKEMAMAQTISLTHHEKWDGSGYPAGISGTEIPLWGRIVALADVMDSLLSQRPYKDSMDFDKVLDYIRVSAGSHFDPTLVSTVLENVSTFREITLRFNSGEAPAVSLHINTKIL